MTKKTLACALAITTLIGTVPCNISTAKGSSVFFTAAASTATGTAVTTTGSSVSADLPSSAVPTPVEDVNNTNTAVSTKKDSPKKSNNIKRKAKLPRKGTKKQIGKYKYVVTKSSSKNGTVSIFGVKNKKMKHLVIPEHIYVNGYRFKVTSIKNAAFAGCKRLKTVSVGSNIKVIGSNAFKKCKNLKIVDMTRSKKISCIKMNAFSGIKRRVHFEIPKGKFVKYVKLLTKLSSLKAEIQGSEGMICIGSMQSNE